MNIELSGRFKDAIWFPKPENGGIPYVLLGGSGGTGSWLSLLLARAGFNVVTQDFDTIEKHNIGGQLYKVNDIGKKKVDALQAIIAEFTDSYLDTYEIPITDYDSLAEETPYMFSCFDNMVARKNLFNNWKEFLTKYPEKKDIAIYIDMRLGFQDLQVFCVTPDNIERYEATLFNDEDIPDEACTLKQTSHCAAMIASFATSFFLNHYANVRKGEKIFEVPFKWTHSASFNMTTTEL